MPPIIFHSNTVTVLKLSQKQHRLKRHLENLSARIHSRAACEEGNDPPSVW